MIQFFSGVDNLTTYASPFGNNVTSITLAKPANIADGDLLIAVVYFQNADVPPVITPPAGWSRIGPAIGPNPIRPSGFYVLPVPTAADVTATDWTWTVNVAPGRARGLLFRATGVDLNDPEDAHGTWAATTGTSSVVLPEVVSTTSNSALLAMVTTNNSAGSGYPVATPPPPMEGIASINTPPDANANSLLWAGFEIISSAGATGTRTVSLSPSATNSGGYMIALKESGALPNPIVVHNISGVARDDGFQIAFKTQNVTTGVRGVVSTSPALSNPVYTSSVMPDVSGYGRVSISGLNPDTIYHWALELDGVVSGDYHGQTRTYPAEGQKASFSFMTSSCVNTGNNPTTMDNMRTRVGPDSLPARFFAHLGDFHYVYAGAGPTPIAPNDQVELAGNYDSQIIQSRQHLLFRTVPLSYTWSDVDSFGSNCDSTFPAVSAANAAYRQVFPNPPDLPATTGLYFTWVIGRVRFIQTDLRSFASAKGDPDGPSKTKLGATQKSWFINLIQNSTEKVIVWLSDNPWFGAASVGGNNDGWNAYNTERTEIGNVISTSGRNLIYIHGDTHSLAADDGSNNHWGGFPIVSAAPMSRPDMVPWPGSWTVSNGSFPPSPQAGTAYGWFDIVDTGNYITLNYSGYNAEVEQVSMQVQWFTGRYKRGDNTNMVPYVKISGSLHELQ